MPASGLRLEITESAAIKDAARARVVLAELRALGVRISLDDFGTGYSSLSYLQSLPLDTLKIDRSFVAGIGTDEDKGEIVQLIVGLARTLGLEIVAEGTETAAQVEYLRALGCQFGQGYYFAKPADVRTTAAARRQASGVRAAAGTAPSQIVSAAARPARAAASPRSYRTPSLTTRRVRRMSVMFVERVAVDDDEVGELAGLDRAEIGAEAHRLGRHRRRRADRLGRRQAAAHVVLQLHQQRQAVRVDRRVGAGNHPAAALDDCRPPSAPAARPALRAAPDRRGRPAAPASARAGRRAPRRETAAECAGRRSTTRRGA